MSSLTDSLDAVAQFLMDKIVTNADTLRTSDNIVVNPEFVYYGDQNKIPGTPAVCIEPNNRGRTLQGVSYRTDNEFLVFIMVYVSRVQDEQLSRKQAQQLSEAIEALIHKDAQLGGLLIHGFCELNESGYTFRNGTLFRTNRITYSGYSKTALR